MEAIVTYDARPLIPEVKKYRCKPIKATKTGYKFVCIEEDEEKRNAFSENYGDVIFRNDGSGTARGWNTLSWRWD